MENSIANKRPELIAEWSSKNAPLTPNEVPFGSNKLYWWKGACGHEWQASAKARSVGEGCPICSNARIIPGVNDLESQHPELALEWSPKNGKKPSEVGPGSHKKAIWLGKCGHEWEASIRSRVRGTGCPYCSHNIVLPGFNDLETLSPDVANTSSLVSISRSTKQMEMTATLAAISLSIVRVALCLDNESKNPH